MEEAKQKARTESGTPALRTNGLCRRFPGFLGLRSRSALRSIDLEVPRGTSLGLIGPNGSGKSTLLRLAAGVDRPTAGRVEVFGIDVSRRRSSAARARLAYLPDDSPFPVELSALAVLDLLGALSGLARQERRRRAARMLERVGLTSAARRTLGTYSRGMLRRLGLAQAFLTDPDLVLLDEPTAGLDASGYVALAELTAEARARGASIVVASHVLSDLHEACDRLAVLIDGKQVASGTLAEVMAPAAAETSPVPGLRVEGLDGPGRSALALWVQEHGGTTRPLEADTGGRVALGDLYRRLAPPESGP